jgi:hypothetical protein
MHDCFDRVLFLVCLAIHFFNAAVLQALEDDDLLSEAAALAPVAAWRKAAAAAASRTQPRHLGGSRDGSSPRGGSNSTVAMEQHAKLLRQLGRNALRATAVALQLLQQQQPPQRQRQGLVDGDQAVSAAAAAAGLSEQGAAAAVAAAPVASLCGGGNLPSRLCPGQEASTHVREDLLHHLGVLLQDQAACLGPWFEPWRFRPQRTQLRQLMLHAAQARPSSLLLWLSSQAVVC